MLQYKKNGGNALLILPSADKSRWVGWTSLFFGVRQPFTPSSIFFVAPA